VTGPEFAAPTAAAVYSPNSSDHSPDSSDRVSGELRTALDDVVAAGASGVVLHVDDGSRTYRLASGQARLDPPQPLHPGAEIRVGSVTKSFISTITLQLVGEGRLNLDDTVERWRPGLVPGGARITVRELLNHTSGIFNYTEDATFHQRLIADPLQTVTPEELVALANAHPQLFAPGTSWSYSNTNYVVMGLILQQVTHRHLRQLIEQRIVRPLHLRHTFLPEISPDISGYHAHGYLPPSLTGGGYVDSTRISPTWAWAAGGLVSNVDDLRRFYRALLGGRLLKPAQLAAMKDMVAAGDGLRYGLGLYRLTTACGPIWGNDGGIPGYVTIARNDATGRRGMAIGLATEPDEKMGLPFNRLLTVAACRALGKEPPPSTATNRVPGSRGPAWLNGVDAKTWLRPVA
jgi:D-alanyl-D-alanine carboxypeptidase